MIYIFWTAANIQEAKKIVRDLLNKKWIACASLIPQVLSLYFWQGKIQEDEEVKVILKTKENFYPQLLKEIKKQSSYEVSEISMLEAKKVDTDYLTWLESCLVE